MNTWVMIAAGAVAIASVSGYLGYRAGADRGKEADSQGSGDPNRASAGAAGNGADNGANSGLNDGAAENGDFANGAKTQNGTLTPAQIREKGSETIASGEAGSDMTVRDLLESLPVPIAVSNEYGATVFISRDFERGTWEDGRFTNDDILDMLGLVADSGRSRTRRLTPDGGETWRSVTVSPLGDGLYSVVSVDATERVQFERQQRDFITNVSHELKTPAGAIGLLAETVNDCADDPDTVRHFSQRISQEAARLSELIAHLIELQKTQTIVPDSSLTPIAVAPVVEQAVDDVSVEAARKSVTVTLNLDPQAEARIDEAALRSVVKNLVDNAVRYSSVGAHIGVSVQRTQDGGTKIRVVDNGIGIPPEALKRIFERFYRVDDARSRETGGTGIGLAIVKSTIEEAGGTVTVWSRPREGTTFTITLPSVGAASGDGGTSANDDGLAGPAPGGAGGADDAVSAGGAQEEQKEKEAGK